MAVLLIPVPCSFPLPNRRGRLQFNRTHGPEVPASTSSNLTNCDKRIPSSAQPLARRRRQLELAATGSQLRDGEGEEEEEEEEEKEEEEEEEEEVEEERRERQRGGGGDYVTLTACAVGLFTGLTVVLFNYAVHEIRDLTWDGIPLRGASWLREEPIQYIWQRVVFVPACGGVTVSILNSLRNSLKKDSKDDTLPGSVLKAIAASVTLGTGNSLGPEGPSVEIGSQIAKGFGNLFQWSGGKRLSLIAAGSAAGISSGFNAAVAGCFFAVESVLWPSSAADSSSSLPNATPIVILSSVIASVISEIGLGSDPAFVVPQYDFRSPTGNVVHWYLTLILLVLEYISIKRYNEKGYIDNQFYLSIVTTNK